MSPTPPGKAGTLTENIMAEWLGRLEKRGLAKPETSVYNAAYEAVYAVLSKEKIG